MFRASARPWQTRWRTGPLDRIAAAAEALHRARRIYCLGLCSCHCIAWHLHFLHAVLGDRTALLDHVAGVGTDAIRNATSNDCSRRPSASKAMPSPKS